MKWQTPLVIALLILITKASFALNPVYTYLYDYDGNVSVTYKGVTQPARQDFPFLDGSVLRTDVNGSADITMNGIIGVRISASSELEFIKVNRSDMQVRLNKGTALINMKAIPAGWNLQFKTPAGDAIVREYLLCKFFVKAYKNEKNVNTSFFVSKVGILDVRANNSGAVVKVFETRSLLVSDDVSVPNQRNATDEEMALTKKINSVLIDVESGPKP